MRPGHAGVITGLNVASLFRIGIKHAYQKLIGIDTVGELCLQINAAQTLRTNQPGLVAGRQQLDVAR